MCSFTLQVLRVIIDAATTGRLCQLQHYGMIGLRHLVAMRCAASLLSPTLSHMYYRIDNAEWRQCQDHVSPPVPRPCILLGGGVPNTAFKLTDTGPMQAPRS